MGYSIAEVAEKMNLTAYTLRYYEKEGLLPFVDRSDSGIRNFQDKDLEWLELICCLKNTGMSIKKIKEVISLYLEGDGTLDIRREIFICHREEVINQIAELEKNLDKINFKINYYENICNKNII